jgi:putative effector of murein hydrolase
LTPQTVGLILLTIGVYAASRKLYLRVGHPRLSPVFLTAATIIGFLKLDGLTFASADERCSRPGSQVGDCRGGRRAGQAARR